MYENIDKISEDYNKEYGLLPKGFDPQIGPY